MGRAGSPTFRRTLTRNSYCRVGALLPGHSACTSRPGVGKLRAQ